MLCCWHIGSCSSMIKEVLFVPLWHNIPLISVSNPYWDFFSPCLIFYSKECCLSTKVHFNFHDWKGLLRISLTIEILLTTTRKPWWTHHFLLINMLNFDNLFCLILAKCLPNQMLVLKLLVLIFHGDLKKVYIMDVFLLNHNFFQK